MGQVENPYRLAIWVAWLFIKKSQSIQFKGDSLGHEDDRFLGALGINRQEMRGERKMRGPFRTRIGYLASLAVISARVQRHAEPHLTELSPETLRDLAVAAGHPAEVLQHLESILLHLVSLKTSHVQAYLANAGDSGQTRGASIWCAQALSLAREWLAARGELFPLNDCDAQCVFLSCQSVSAKELGGWLMGRMNDAFRTVNSDPAPILPRLEQYRREYIAEGGDPTEAFSDFTLVTDDRRNLLEASIPQRLASDLEKENMRQQQEACGHRFTLSPPASSQADFCREAPPWWEVSEGRDQTCLDWRGLVWSLAGATYRLHVMNGMARFLGGVRPTSVHHGDLVRHGGKAITRQAYLKLDGDGVGKLFARKPLMSRSRLSLDCAWTLQFCLKNAIQAVDTLFQQDFPSEKLPLLVDLLYLGGDDLLLILPEKYLREFLYHFRMESSQQGLSLYFTFAVVLGPETPGQDNKLQFKKDYPAYVPLLLEVAKGRFHEDNCRDLEAESDLQQALGRVGADYQIRELHIENKLVHGLILEIL